MKTTPKMVFLLVLATSLIISCGKKENKFPLTGRWVVEDAVIQDDYITRDMVLGNYYAFSEKEMVYKPSQYSPDSSLYDLTYLDKGAIQTYNRKFDMKTIYNFELPADGNGKRLTLKSTNGFTYYMRKL